MFKKAMYILLGCFLIGIVFSGSFHFFNQNTPIKEEKQAKIQNISFDEAISFFEEERSGIVYFGFSDCPWCKQARPYLEEQAIQSNTTIYYVKTRDDDKDHTRLYDDEQKKRIQPYIEEYMENNEEGELTLYVPLVLKVEKGKVVTGHMGTVENHDATQRKMNDDEKKELKRIYRKLFLRRQRRVNEIK